MSLLLTTTPAKIQINPSVQLLLSLTYDFPRLSMFDADDLFDVVIGFGSFQE